MDTCLSLTLTLPQFSSRLDFCLKFKQSYCPKYMHIGILVHLHSQAKKNFFKSLIQQPKLKWHPVAPFEAFQQHCVRLWCLISEVWKSAMDEVLPAA